MKLRNAILSCMLLTTALAASAQDTQGTTVNEFQPHFYIQEQFGGQYTLGEVPFADLLSLNTQLGIGYNLTPVFGIRIAANAWQSKGGSTFGEDMYTWKWKYVAPTANLTFNLSNLIGGFKPDRLCSVGVYVGLGANIAWNNDEAWEQNTAMMTQAGHEYNAQALEYLWDGMATRLLGNAGLNIDFRISDAVSAGVELQACGLNDTYNSKKAYNPDWYFNALASVKINLGKTHTSYVVPAVAPEVRYVDKYVDKIVEKQVPCPEVEEGIRRDIFFSINSSEITDAEAHKVEDIADFLKANPEAVVSVFGVADAGTGNDRINNRLASQRAAAVVKLLTDKYGINANRIIGSSNGAKTQPFAENDKNRVTICIAE